MTRYEAKKRFADAMQKASARLDDPESAHIEADDAVEQYLRDTDQASIADAVEELRIKVGGFWYA